MQDESDLSDIILVQDSSGEVRRVYRHGCARCGKPTEGGATYCKGHAYMESRRAIDEALRHPKVASSLAVRFWRWAANLFGAGR